jgi:putative transposase
MLRYTYKLYGTEEQFRSVDAAIQTVQFIRNSVLDVWMKNGKLKEQRAQFGWPEMCRMSTELRKQHEFCKNLYSDACQVAAERAWNSVKNFYEKCKDPAYKNKKKGYPRYRDNCRSVEYKAKGWFFSEDFRKITFRDKTGMGTFTLKGGKWLDKELVKLVQRVQVVKAQGCYFLQLVLKLTPEAPDLTPTECATAFDLGLKEFMTSHRGEATANPRFLQKSQSKLARAQRKLSKKKKGGKNRKKQAKKVRKIHGQVANQREDFARKLAKCVVTSNDVVVFEDLNMAALVKGFLAKSIHDVGWGMFLKWIKHYCEKFGRQLILVDPANTTQACSACGCLPTEKITLAVREYHCEHCGLVLDRDLNAAINILKKALLLVQEQLATAGHAESWSYVLHCLKKALAEVELLNVFGERTSTSSAHAEPASPLVELETASMFSLNKFDDPCLKDHQIA